MALLRRALLGFGLVLGLLALVAPASCYEPRQPPCAFSCADDGLCPSGFTCGSDGVCHRDGTQGTCDIPPQIDAADAGTNDGGDAGTDDAAGGDDTGADATP